MKSLTLIVKVTDGCNMRCKYCYNSDSGYTSPVLPLEKLEKLLSVLATEFNEISVVWHGGEPLIAGMDYFARALEIENTIAKRCSSLKFTNSVQTNGTLINAKWAKFFKQNNFNPGISFDGLNNDKYRGNTEKTLAAIKLLKKHNVPFGCMSVVADDEFDLRANYDYFAKLGVGVEFSPVFAEGVGKNAKQNTEKFASDLISLFDFWLTDTKGVAVRTFASYLSMALGQNRRICANCSCIGKFLSISPDGKLYNCNRYSVRQYPFADVDDVQIIKDIFGGEKFVEFLKGSIERRNKCKSTCDLFDACNGGCSDCAMIENGLTEIPQNSCYLFKTVYRHIKQAADKLVTQQPPLNTLNPTVAKILINGTKQNTEKVELQ